MKLLCHPNIVKIYEVLATKTKIYLVMEYVSGGQLSNKMDYLERLDEREARKYFQQLIDALDYCHGMGIYHRDLKPENLLLDSKGDLKVSDFGLSVLRKISRADYRCPDWFTAPQKRLLLKILDPLPSKRATIADILEEEWFLIDYESSVGIENEESTDIGARERSPGFVNAFQLIAMSDYLDLSSLFKDIKNEKMKLGSMHSVDETIQRIHEVAEELSLLVQRINNSKVKLHGKKRTARSRSQMTLEAELIEVTEAHCIVEISKYIGEIRVYEEFCKCLSSVLG